MIDEFRQYEFTANAWEHYWELFENLCLPIRGDRFGALQGMWQERIGDNVIFRHLWRYDSLDERARLRGELIKVAAWREEFLPQAARHVGKQFLQVLVPRVEFAVGGLAPVRYLHVYRCPVGKAGAVIEQVSDAGARKKHRVFGVWATEFADPNQVVVMSARATAPAVDVQASLVIETRSLQPLGLDVRQPDNRSVVAAV
ncbi:NIPSNAP family protein [Pseudomonas sp. NPDC090202]|uniref:NIPSNAP family protein n=1 Tax=unclassified Pseudomonas TaxID=196821 RepID=UPI00380819D5